MKNKLWIVGCSIAHGVGVDPSERWGAVVARTLQIDVEFFTAEGSSIEWAADRILQADIGPDDVVLWGLTTPNRFVWYNDAGQAQHVINVYYQNNPSFDQEVPRNQLVQLNLAYKAVNHVRQVQNYLDKIGCKFAIGYTLPGLDEHRQIMLDRLIDTAGFFIAYDTVTNLIAPSPTEFFNLTRPSQNIFVDVGHDGFHPGPQQHKLYCNKFLNKLQSSS